MITENINRSEDIDPHARLLNKLLSVRLKDGYQFAAKLVLVQGQLLYFENKNGKIYADHLDDITSIREVV
jgi:hypothetical protein